MSEPSPECFDATAHAYDNGQLSFEQFIDINLRHFSGERHPEDDVDTDESLASLLQWKVGQASAAMKICALEPGFDTPPIALLRPVLLACVSGNFEGFTSLDDAMKSQSDISVFSKPYLLQIALLIAISHENDTLASELAKVGRPPPRCVFHLEHGPPRIINQGVLSILIGRGWIIAHQATVFYAVKSSDATSSIALFQAIADSDFDLDNDIYRTALPKLAAKYGSPEMLQHILAYFSIPRPDPNLILEAVRERKSGGADMLRYLMNQATDVNHTKASNIPRSNGSSKPGHGGYGDPRARAEMEYAQITARYGQSTSRHSPGADTALHLAAQNGNLDAVRVLLDRGARRDAKDAAGRTPSQRVQQVNRKEVLKMLEEQM